MSNCLCLACDRANPLTIKFCTEWGAKLQIHDRYRALKVIVLKIFDKCYRDARKQAKIETRLPLAHFPEICPFTSEQVLDEDFLPE